MTTGSWFILFKAAQCAHCKKLAPEFQQLANDEALADAGIVFATVDVPSNRRTAVRFGVRYVVEATTGGTAASVNVALRAYHAGYTRNSHHSCIVSIAADSRL